MTTKLVDLWISHPHGIKILFIEQIGQVATPSLGVHTREGKDFVIPVRQYGVLDFKLKVHFCLSLELFLLLPPSRGSPNQHLDGSRNPLLRALHYP